MTERIIGNQIRLPPIIGMMRCPCCGIGTGISVSRWIAGMRHTMWNFYAVCTIILAPAAIAAISNMRVRWLGMFPCKIMRNCHCGK